MHKALLHAAALASLLAFPLASLAQHETGADLFSGEQVFQNLCANCHGLDGALVPNVDLGHGVFRQPYTDAQLVAIILKGIQNTPMPPNPTMSEQQAQLVVDYLRSRAIDSSSALAGSSTPMPSDMVSVEPQSAGAIRAAVMLLKPDWKKV